MKTCDKCCVSFDYIDYTQHRCYTVQEWKKFSNNPVKAENNDFQFFNYITQRIESYDYLTTAEVLLSKYIIYIVNHTNRKRIGGFVVIPLKEKLKDGLKSLPSKMTQKNFNKGMKVFDESMQGLTKSLDQLGDGLGGKKDNRSKMEKLWGDTKSKKTLGNMDFIWGKPSRKKSSNSLKIWSDPVQPKKKRKTRRKSQSDKWDKHESNMEKIWGKKK